jgi:hypothetical protein
MMDFLSRQLTEKHAGSGDTRREAGAKQPENDIHIDAVCTDSVSESRELSYAMSGMSKADISSSKSVTVSSMSMDKVRVLLSGRLLDKSCPGIQTGNAGK